MKNVRNKACVHSQSEYNLTMIPLHDKNYFLFPSRPKCLRTLPSFATGSGGEGLFVMNNLTAKSGNPLKDFLNSLYELTKNKSAHTILCQQIYSASALILFLINLNANYAFAESSQNYINLDRIASIESNENDFAVSPKNAIGRFQITEIALKDFLQNNPTSKIKFSDLRKPEVSAHVAIWLLEVRAPQLLGNRDSLRNRLITYNCGISCVGKPLPKETQNYLKKYGDL